MDGYYQRNTHSDRKGTFDPHDARWRVRHEKLGVWDVYEEINVAYASWTSWTNE